MLLSWRTQLADFRVWSSFNGVPTLEQFAVEMETVTRQSVMLLVVKKADLTPIGFLQAYGINLVDGWCFLAAYFAPKYRRQRYGSEAFVPFVDHLFRHFNLRKIYMEFQEFNMGFFDVALKTGAFVEEGRFRQHTWHENRYWDMIRVALYRDSWEEVREWAQAVLQDTRPGTHLVEEHSAKLAGSADRRLE